MPRMETTNPAMAKGEKGCPFFEMIAVASPAMPMANPPMKPMGRQQQLINREIIPRTMEVTAKLFTGAF